MKKDNLVIIGKAVALVCSVAGLIFTINGQHHESSIAWNSAAVALWAISLTT